MCLFLLRALLRCGEADNDGDSDDEPVSFKSPADTRNTDNNEPISFKYLVNVPFDAGCLVDTPVDTPDCVVNTGLFNV